MFDAFRYSDDSKGNSLWGCGTVIVMAAVVMAALAWMFCFVTIPKGEVGVLSWFGDVQNSTLEAGPHFIHPLKRVYRVNIQTQKDEEAAVVPTKKGLAVGMKAVLLFHLKPDKAPMMAREVGENYVDRVVTPYFKNAVRDVSSEFEAEAFYTSDRTLVESRVLARVTKELEARGIEVESVMLLDPELPPIIKGRIEAKAGAEQDAARMEFVLKQKELEAKAKVVEAKGIADAQSIIKKDLDDNYLRYLWIEALKSHSGATIYIPTGGDGMPFFKPIHPEKK